MASSLMKWRQCLSFSHSEKGKTAMTSAVGKDSTVILDEDVLHMVYSLLNVQDLQALRVLNHRSEAVASCYLFKTVIVRPRKDHLAVLTRISENETFARGVREVLWETGHYVETVAGVYARGTLHDQSDDGMVKRPRITMNLTAERLLEEEEAAPPELLGTLTAALDQVYGTEEGRSLLMGSAVRGLAEALGEVYREHERQARACSTLLFALSAAGRTVHALRVQPTDSDVDRVIYSRARGGLVDKLGLHMNIVLPVMSDAEVLQAAQPFRHLTKLRLRPRGDSTGSIPLLRSSSSLSQITAQATMLEELEVSLDAVLVFKHPIESYTVNRRLVHVPIEAFVPQGHILPHLRRLHLEFFCVKTYQFCNFLPRHFKTLELLTLSTVVLNDRKVFPDDSSGSNCFLFHDKDLTDYDARPQGRNVRFIDRADQPNSHRDEQLEGWKAVARTCRQLGRLEGLRFETPIVWGYGRAFLCDAEELEMAIDGRSNCLRAPEVNNTMA